mmetsp:Transcript_10690/g.12507  ORF Transcript_10690/g.12507 Transcript_10690/m.12507 type:complete len:166 (-) Transcript_10690:588-1085(-)|eukprot:CAMPEP_0197852996 /NCGR_PEP_ID=MMETSP1438-20131217/21904_1 /TAXON_ID=1461541 /ORGANISM="Pterosperma sp., Strain CCMP1384" /LENGTH=165 /DNA_ID=CAMNT_0043467259 /DNA_START=263 /DNA_END=760 /DNA_ORIENTATION=-
MSARNIIGGKTAAGRAAEILGKSLEAAKAAEGFKALDGSKKLPTVFQLGRNLEDFGVGTKITRPTWLPTKAQPKPCYWEITKVKPKACGEYGRAWGILVWRGEPQLHGDGPNGLKKPNQYVAPLRGANKKTWMLWPETCKTVVSFPRVPQVTKESSTTAEQKEEQ